MCVESAELEVHCQRPTKAILDTDNNRLIIVIIVIIVIISNNK